MKKPLPAALAALLLVGCQSAASEVAPSPAPSPAQASVVPASVAPVMAQSELDAVLSRIAVGGVRFTPVSERELTAAKKPTDEESNVIKESACAKAHEATARLLPTGWIVSAVQLPEYMGRIVVRIAPNEESAIAGARANQEELKACSPGFTVTRGGDGVTESVVWTPLKFSAKGLTEVAAMTVSVSGSSAHMVSARSGRYVVEADLGGPLEASQLTSVLEQVAQALKN